VFLLAIGYFVWRLLEEEDASGRITESGPAGAARAPQPRER
jgi:hypothetical protein